MDEPDDAQQEYMRQAYDTNIDLIHAADGDVEIDDIESMFDGEDDDIVQRLPREETIVAVHTKNTPVPEPASKPAPESSSEEAGCGADCACIGEKANKDSAPKTSCNGDENKSSCCSDEEQSGGCCSTTSAPTVTPVDEPVSNHVPTQGRVHVQTWGCSHNTSDAEYMAGKYPFVSNTCIS